MGRGGTGGFEGFSPNNSSKKDCAAASVACVTEPVTAAVERRRTRKRRIGTFEPGASGRRDCNITNMASMGPAWHVRNNGGRGDRERPVLGRG
jgi:hypothetical protein